MYLRWLRQPVWHWQTWRRLVADGKKVVFAAIDDRDSKSRLWLASVDRSSPPRRLSPPEGQGPVFSEENLVVFRAPEGNQHYLYELDLDSGDVRKAVADAAVNAPTVSPDGQWIISSVGRAGESESNSVMAYPKGGGLPVAVCDWCYLKWTGNGRFLFLSFRSGSQTGKGKTFVIRLDEGKLRERVVQSSGRRRNRPVGRVSGPYRVGVRVSSTGCTAQPLQNPSPMIIGLPRGA